MVENFFLNFRGYWSASDLEEMPNLPGIFCVYRCCFDYVSQKLVPTQLLYIGASLAARDQIHDHETRSRWERHLRRGEELGYSYAPILRGREQAAAALIFRHKPVENGKHKHHFPFDFTGVTLTGRIAFLDFSFYVPDRADALRAAAAGSERLLRSG